jgi:hypothetical protein
MEEVYDAVYEYLKPENSNIPYLGAIYKALPRVSNEADLFNFVPPGTGVGVVIYLFCERKNETRIALGGLHDGRKWVPFSMSLLCIMKSDLPRSDAGQAAFNQFVDGLTDYVRADRNAGTGTTPNARIFQWGEGGENGGPDIEFEFPVPKTADGGVMLFQCVARIQTIQVDDT